MNADELEQLHDIVEQIEAPMGETTDPEDTPWFQ
jgi:hypothetical protein